MMKYVQLVERAKNLLGEQSVNDYLDTNPNMPPAQLTAWLTRQTKRSDLSLNITRKVGALVSEWANRAKPYSKTATKPKYAGTAAVRH